MNTIYKIVLMLFVTSLLSCEKFLEDAPNKSGSAYIYHMDQLYALSGNYSLYQAGYTWTDQIFLGDAIEYSPYYVKATGESGNVYNVWQWDLSYLENGAGTATTWAPVWNAIYSCNTILENLDNVEQTSPKIRQQVEGEALFSRAYFHFIALVNYTLWKEDAPGIGYRTNTSPTDVPARETVKYTLDKIHEDLNRAEKLLSESDRATFDATRKFRPTVVTVKALRARIHLYRGNYPEALKNADDALAGHSTLVDFKNDPIYKIVQGEEINFLDKTNTTIVKKDNFRQLSLTGSGATVWEYPEFYLPHVSDLYYANRVLPISQSYYDLFDHDKDQRWKFFYNNNLIVHSSRILKTMDLPGKPNTTRCFTWEDQQGIKEANRHSYLRFASSPGSSGKYYLLGMTTAEMYLIKAECLSRAGKTGDAATALRTLRRARFADNASADNIGGTLKEVLDERAREMAELWRYFDIKRLNGADNANTKIQRTILTNPTDLNTEKTIEILPNDSRWAVPIDLTQRLLMKWGPN